MSERRLPAKQVTCRFYHTYFSLKSRLKQTVENLRETYGKHTSKEVVPAFPVPVSPEATTIPTCAPFPQPVKHPEWYAGRQAVAPHELEATGSNHTSNHTSTHTSEYFDAKDPHEYVLQHQLPDDFAARLRNRRQHGIESESSAHGFDRPPYQLEHTQDRFEDPHGFKQPSFEFDHSQHGIGQPQFEFDHSQHGILQPQFDFEDYQNGVVNSPWPYGFQHPPDEFEHSQCGIGHSRHGFERPHPQLGEQLAGCFSDMVLDTSPTSHSRTPPLPWGNEFSLDPVSVNNDDDPDQFYSGELDQGLFHQQGTDATGESFATATEQGVMTAMEGGGVSITTGETGESWESLTDTAGSSITTAKRPYILAPVPEAKPSLLQRMPFYRHYVDFRQITRGEKVAFESARRGRRIRVLGRAFCYAVRLRTKTGLSRKGKRSGTKRILESQRLYKLCPQSRKRMRTVVAPPQPSTSGVTTVSTPARSYKGVTPRNGKWHSEKRVSACKLKVWFGTFDTEREAALAQDAGSFHCTERLINFNFPEFKDQLGTSQYPTVKQLYDEGRKDEATELVKSLAAKHANTFGGAF